MMNNTQWSELSPATPYARTFQNRETGELIRIDVITDKILRLRMTRNAQFSERESSQLCADLPCTSEKLRREFAPLPRQANDLARYQAGQWILGIGNDGHLSFFNTDGELLLREKSQRPREYQMQEIMRPDWSTRGEIRTSVTVDGEKQSAETRWVFDRNAWMIRWNLEFSDGEALYGLGQHENDFLNYRGRSEVLYQHNMKVAMPVLLSTQGYGVFLDTEGLCSFHDDGIGSYFWAEAQEELDVYLVYGPDFDAIVSGMRTLTGRAQPLPLWACGFWQSKERYEDAEQLLAVAREYRARKLPLDGMVQDWKYWPEGQWGQKSFDFSRYPAPQAMCDQLHQMNLHLIISIWPNMNGMGENQKEFLANGEMLGNQSTYNAFDANARSRYFRQTREGLLDFGIDGLWCDCTEPFEADWHGAVRPEPTAQLQADTGEAKKYLPTEKINSFSLLHSAGLYEHHRAAYPNRRMVNLTRSGSPGSQRYGAIVWSGDVSANYQTLRHQMTGGLNYTVCGAPKWSCDIGGFFVRQRPEYWFWQGEYPDGVADPAYRTLFVRWFQLGAFLPVFRAHGTDTPRELWQFGEPGEAHFDALEKALRLRYRLLPYLYSNMLAESLTDYTSFRMLAFDFRQDRNVHNIADQFLCGSALLIAPIVTETPEREVYLPAGYSWIEFATGKSYTGGQTIRLEATLDDIPIFVRSGSIIAMCESRIEYAEQILTSPVTLHIYGGADSHTTVYSDAGDGHGWENSEFNTWECHYDATRSTLKVNLQQSCDIVQTPPSYVIHELDGTRRTGELNAFGLEQTI